MSQTEAVDTDKYSEDKRMAMCKKAIKINALKRTEFKFLPKPETGPKTPYIIELKGADRRSDPEYVVAFKCPTKPPIYLQVVEEEDDKERVWVIFNEDEPEEVKFVGDDESKFENTTIFFAVRANL